MFHLLAEQVLLAIATDSLRKQAQTFTVSRVCVLQNRYIDKHAGASTTVVPEPHTINEVLSTSASAGVPHHDIHPLAQQLLAQLPSTAEIAAAVAHADISDASQVMHQLGSVMGARLAVLRPLDPIAFASLATSLTSVVDSVHQMLNAEAAVVVQQSLISMSLASQQVAAAVGEQGSAALLAQLAVPVEVSTGAPLLLAVLQPLNPIAFASLAMSLTSVVDSVHQMLKSEAAAVVQQTLISMSLAPQQVAAAVGENGLAALPAQVAVSASAPLGRSHRCRPLKIPRWPEALPWYLCISLSCRPLKLL
jgi:hypothetical protein